MAVPTYATPLERIWHYAYLVICGLIFFFLIAPIIVIIPLSFNAEPFFSFTEGMLTLDPEAYSLRWYREILNDPKWILAIKNSFVIGIFATVLATVLGTCAAVGLARDDMPYRRFITALLLSPMIVPLIITATGMFFFYSNPCGMFGLVGVSVTCGKLAGTYAGVIMAHAILGIPFVIITVTATLIGFDQSLARAAASLGAGPRRTFFRIIMPLILPGVISGALFAFVTSFDEVVAVLFIAGPEQQTIPRQMWNGIREQISPAILAVATLLVIFSIALLTTVELLRRRSERIRGVTPH